MPYYMDKSFLCFFFPPPNIFYTVNTIKKLKTRIEGKLNKSKKHSYLDKRAFRSQKFRFPSTSPSTSVSPFHAMQAMLPMLPCNTQQIHFSKGASEEKWIKYPA